MSIGVSQSAYAVMPDGTVRSWGNNTDGALGLGDYDGRDSPTPIPGLSGAVATSGSEETGFAIVAG